LKRNAEARKQVEFDRYQRQMEIDKQKRQKPKQKTVVPPKKEEQTPQASTARPTFSLFGIGGPPESKEESAPVVDAAPQTKKSPTLKVAKTTATAPRGVPTLSKWSLNSDNTISGFISGSPNFKDGSPVTTSAITGSAVSGSVVQTKSKSKYFLGEESSGGDSSSGGGLFGGLFGGGGEEKAPVVKSAPVRKSAPVKKDDGAAERKRIAEQAALEKKRKAEEIAAEKQRKAEKAKAAAAAKREAQLQAKKDAEEKRRIAAEGK